MSVYLDHRFKDGSSIRFLTKPFEPAKKEVPTIEFNFPQGGVMKTLNARLYDVDVKTDFARELYQALAQYLIKGKKSPSAVELTTSAEPKIEAPTFVTKET